MTTPIHRFFWLALGAGLLFLSQLRFGLGALAWIAPIPWLFYLRHSSGWRARALVPLFLVLAWFAAMAKIVTPPLTMWIAPGFAIPLGLVSSVPYLLWGAMRPRTTPARAALLFAACVVPAEWILHAALPFGTWGALANTQVDQLALLQLASITGLHGVSFLIAWVAASAEAFLADRSQHRGVLVAVAVTALLTVAGQARLAHGTDQQTAQNRVAAIDTDSTFGGLPLPTTAELEHIDAELLRRTREAARAGAKLVVWTEAATLVLPADEAKLIDRVREVAATEKIHIAAAWVVPVQTGPLLYENKHLLVDPSGAVRYTYLKHRPVPGEPAIPGVGPMPVVEDAELGRISGALCYDYDFPRLGLAHADVGADLIALPSSDWRGIDPIHTQMAAIRAIELGASIVRSTRFGLSGAIDPYGRLRAWQSHFEPNDGVMLAELPARRVWTFYAWAGDWFIAASVLLTLSVLVAALRARYPARRAAGPGHSVAGAPGAVPEPGRGALRGGA